MSRYRDPQLQVGKYIFLNLTLKGLGNLDNDRRVRNDQKQNLLKCTHTRTLSNFPQFPAPTLSPHSFHTKCESMSEQK